MAKEWSEKNTISPEKITAVTSKIFWWKCSKCSYEWKSSVKNRYNGNGCPKCSGRVPSDKNRLSFLYPEIVKEWHPIKNKNLTPDDVSFGSEKRFGGCAQNVDTNG